MPTGRLSGPSGRRGNPVRQLAAELGLPDGSTVSLLLHALDARGDRISVHAEDADGRTVGCASYARVYGPRAELELEIDDRSWPSGLPEVLVASICDVAAGHGIATLLVRARAAETRLRLLLSERFGARAVRAGESVDLEIATDRRSSAGPAGRCHDDVPDDRSEPG